MGADARPTAPERASPLDEIPPFELFGGVSEDAWRWLNLEGPEHCSFLARYLPSLPRDPEFQARFTGRSGLDTLTMGFEIYELFKALYERYAGDRLRSSSRVLDFGCGWGRVIRFFLKDVAPRRLIGIDMYDEARLAAAESNRWCRFRRCVVLPPTTLRAENFDLVYAFSVFSHLSEEAHARWLDEFHRILQPGGVLLLTTFNRAFLEDSPTQRPDVAERFAPLDRSLSRYERGEFCYRPLAERNPHFGDAFIPESYVRRHWTKNFVVQEFFEAPAWGQNIVVCTKQ